MGTTATTREIGDVLEDYLIKELGFNGNRVDKTPGSGAVRGDADIHGTRFAIEAKATIAKKSISLKRDVWLKAIRQAQSSRPEDPRYPVLVHGFVDVDRGIVEECLVTVSLDYLKHVLNPGKAYDQTVTEALMGRLRDRGVSEDIMTTVKDALWDIVSTARQ